MRDWKTITTINHQIFSLTNKFQEKPEKHIHYIKCKNLEVNHSEWIKKTNMHEISNQLFKSGTTNVLV